MKNKEKNGERELWRREERKEQTRRKCADM